MKNLFVHQRVRIVSHEYRGNMEGNPYYGMTGRITEKGPFGPFLDNIVYDWQMQLDDPRFSDGVVYANSHELEPILDPPKLADPEEFEKFLEDNKYREGIAA